MDTDIIILKMNYTRLYKILKWVVAINLFVFLLIYKDTLKNAVILIVPLLFILVLGIFGIVFHLIKSKHDQFIRIEIENRQIVKYFEKNECLYTFNVSDIQSITYYEFLKSYPVASIDLKNKMNIYLSNLIDVDILFTLNDQIEKENFVSHFMEELWNPIFSVQNQLNLLNNQK